MVACPICNSESKPLDRTGDAVGLDCPVHGTFKVAGSVFAVETCKNASRENWESALKKAKENARPGIGPVITTYDF